MTHKHIIGPAAQYIACAICAFAIGTCADANLSAQERPTAQRVEVPTAIRPVPLEAANRYAKLSAVAQPSVRAWVESQARVELQRSTLDTASLNAAIQSRFGGAKGSRASASTGIPAGADIDALAFMVLMQAASDQNQDLQEIMNEVQVINNAKVVLRNAMSTLQNELSRTTNIKAAVVCMTPGCLSIAQQLRDVETLTSKTEHPVRFATYTTPTFGQLRQAQTAANQSLDSLSDMSQSMQMKLQMEQSQYSQIVEAISNIEKKMNDTSENIIQNMK